MTGSETAPLRAGIIGLSAERGWASEAHLPALLGLPGLQVTAVATRSLATAEAAARKYGIPHAFGSVEELAKSDVIDLGVVSVRAPAHLATVEALARGGKHIYCEWPLGISEAEAEHMVAIVDAAGIRHMIGLQGFCSPGAAAVRDLIRSGGVGKVCAASFVASGGPHGPITRAALAYTVDRAAGASILHVHLGHWLATLETVLGQLTSVSGLVETVVDEVGVEGSSERLHVTAPDQVAFVASFGDRAVLAGAAQSGVAKAAYDFQLRIVGTEGTLVITPSRQQVVASTGERRHDSFHFTEWQVRRVSLSGQDELIDLTAAIRGDIDPAVPDGAALNVAHFISKFADAIRNGSPVEPSFHTGLRYHRLLERLQASSASGQRRDVADLTLPALTS